MRARYRSGWLRRAARLLSAASLLGLLVASQAYAQAQTAEATRAEAVEPVTASEVGAIRQAFKNLNLTQADVAVGPDGRITLTGEYENRDAVETAFSAARAVVGLRRVAPTTPADIKYRLAGFENAFASTVARMMQGSPTPAPAAAPAAPPAVPSAVPSAVPAPTAAPPANRAPRTFALVVGAGKNEFLPPKYALEGASEDASDFYSVLLSPAGKALPPDAVRLLTERQATSAAVRAGLDDLLDKTQPGDTAVLFVAAHGLPNALGNFDIVLYDTAFPTRQVTAQGQSLEFVITDRKTALSDEELESFVAQLTAKHVRAVIVLDTCYSGKVFVDIPGYLPSRTRSLTEHEQEREYSTSMSQQQVTALAQKARDMKTTRIVIVSSSEDQESLEAPGLGGGLFTQTYLRFLRKDRDYADAFDDTKPAVIHVARTMGYSQTPRMLVVPETAATKM